MSFVWAALEPALDVALEDAAADVPADPAEPPAFSPAAVASRADYYPPGDAAGDVPAP